VGKGTPPAVVKADRMRNMGGQQERSGGMTERGVAGDARLLKESGVWLPTLESRSENDIGYYKDARSHLPKSSE
jgi:hypothetical protein